MPGNAQPAKARAVHEEIRCAGDALVTLDVHDGVGTVRLNRPPVNALNAQLRAELATVCGQAAATDEVRAVVVYGGPKHFAAGADVGKLESVSLAEMAGQVEQLQASLGAMAGIGKPTVAANHRLRPGRWPRDRAGL